MIFKTKSVTLKNNISAIFRAPTPEDSVQMLEYLKTTAVETEFVIRYPDECNETPEQEAKYLQNVNDSPNNIMIVCEIDGEIAGNCQLSFGNRFKTRHRATVAIALLSRYWGIGIGTAMFNEMIELAKQNGITQLELQFTEGNERGRRLYEKMGFRIVGELPNAMHLRDGRSLSLFTMIRQL